MPRAGRTGGKGVCDHSFVMFAWHTADIQTCFFLACAGSWSKVGALSYTEVWEVIAILSQSVP